MLEFIAIYLLAKRNGDLVQRKGKDGFPYRVITAVLWIAGEVLGFIVAFRGIEVTETYEAYLFAIAGAAVGAAFSWLLANSVGPATPGWLKTHSVPPGGMPAWAAPDGTVGPVAMLPAGLELCVRDARGDWAFVQASNGWTGWVDGRYLVPAASGGVVSAAR